MRPSNVPNPPAAAKGLESGDTQANPTMDTNIEATSMPPPPARTQQQRGSPARTPEERGGSFEASNTSIDSSNEAGDSGANGSASDGSVRGGIGQLKTKLRSIVMSETTFRCFLGFNENREVGDLLKTQEFEKLSGLKIWNSTNKYQLPEPQGEIIEKNLTDEMVKTLNTDVARQVNCQDEENRLIVIGEGNLPRAQEGESGGNNPSLDVAIGRGDQLLGFIEVGLTKKGTKCDETKFREIDKLFWEKVDQSCKYLRLLYTNEGSVRKKMKQKEVLFEIQSDGTILFAVFVLARDMSMGRMAVFTAERKGQTEDFRVALMWRCESQQGYEKLKMGYSAFINAVTQLPLKNEFKWEYLGPDCSKVTPKKVLSSLATC